MKGFTLVNYNDHPTNRRKKVFFFHQQAHANYFEMMLIESKIKYEKQVDEKGDGRFYFGIGVADFKQVQHYNYLTIGHYRKRFISDKPLRVVVLTISIIVLTLAIAGAIISNL